MSIECPVRLHSPQGIIGEITISAQRSIRNFAKSFQFSPCGTLALSATEQDLAVVSALDADTVNMCRYYQHSIMDQTQVKSPKPSLSHRCSIPIGESIYDLKWHPSSNSSAQYFASTSRDHPTILWDVTDENENARMLSSYRGYDQADELEAAISLCFNLTGDKLYAGSNRTIRCFDVGCPGKDCFTIATSPTKKSPYGQKGLISSLAFNPDYSGTYSAGSYADSVGIYVENSDKCALLLSTSGLGVTSMKWSPCGRYLWVGGRNCSTLQCWDIRSTQNILGTVNRDLGTNQRMSFDLDPWGKYLCTGDQTGKLLYYDATTFDLIQAQDIFCDQCRQPFETHVSPVCVNSVAFHPYSALLGVAVGERSFDVVADDTSSESGSDEEGDRYCQDGNHSVEGAVGPLECESHDGNNSKYNPGNASKRRKLNVSIAPISSQDKKWSKSESYGFSSVQLWSLGYIPQLLPPTEYVQPDWASAESSAHIVTEVVSDVNTNDAATVTNTAVVSAELDTSIK